MQDVIDSTVNALIKNIDSKSNSSAVARQFVLEELDAAKEAVGFVRERIDTFYFDANEFVGAMGRSWVDVDGEHGPQQYLNVITKGIAQSANSEIAAMVRISIVEYIIKHYGFGRYYLDETIRNSTKPLDLFSLKTTEDKLHSHFKYLMKDENQELREVLMRWSSGFVDRDNKLIQEFQTTFNSSFWELYLNQCFSDLGMEIDFSEASPDFIVCTNSGTSLCIEAVTANHARNSPAEWECAEISSDKEFLTTSCVRILNAIASKHKKYVGSYSKLAHVKGKPFLVALAPFEQPHFFAQNNEAIIRVLYGQGVASDLGFKTVNVPTENKNKNTTLDLGIFTNEKYKEISAVIFSTTATISKVISQTSLKRQLRVSRFDIRRGLNVEFIDNAYHFETHLDGLQIHYNPYAICPVAKCEFDKYEITEYFYDIENKEIDNKQKNYTLISRTIF